MGDHHQPTVSDLETVRRDDPPLDDDALSAVPPSESSGSLVTVVYTGHQGNLSLASNESLASFGPQDAPSTVSTQVPADQARGWPDVAAQEPQARRLAR